MDTTEVTGRRIGAIAIDSLLFGLLFVVIGIATGGGKASGGNASVNLGGGAFALFLAITIVYFVVCEGTSGQTLGKRLLRVRVVSDDGRPMSWGQSVGRNVLRLIDSLPAFYIVGLIVVLATGQRRKRIGDLAAGTRVVSM